MASKTTKYDLAEVTDYLGFESLCHDLMSREGYKSIQPLGGTGDKGRDAIHFDKSASISTVFAYSVRKDWETKLEEDLKTVSNHGHECDQFIFVGGIMGGIMGIMGNHGVSPGESWGQPWK